jgi:hypothetical protein
MTERQEIVCMAIYALFIIAVGIIAVVVDLCCPG